MGENKLVAKALPQSFKIMPSFYYIVYICQKGEIRSIVPGSYNFKTTKQLDFASNYFKPF